MNAQSLAIVAVSLFAASSVWAADCSSVDIGGLLQQEQERAGAAHDCAHMDPSVANDGGPDGECVASPRALDVAEAGAASCMSKEQMGQFSQLADQAEASCAIIGDWAVDHNYVHDAQCHRDRSWLVAFRQEQYREESARSEEELRTPAGLREREWAREEDLQECSRGSKEVILSGDMADGVCSVDWSSLSPAEAKAAERLSNADLEEFRHLRFLYESDCNVLHNKLGEKADAPSLCGADWRWLDRELSTRKAKKSSAAVGRALETKPF